MVLRLPPSLSGLRRSETVGRHRRGRCDGDRSRFRDSSTLTGAYFSRRLSSRLQPLIQRGVPPRFIEAAPAPRAARLRFADGTTVLVKVAVPGELGTLALTMRYGSLRPARCTTDPDGSAHLLLSCSGEHRHLWLHVVGLDQPD